MRDLIEAPWKAADHLPVIDTLSWVAPVAFQAEAAFGQKRITVLVVLRIILAQHEVQDRLDLEVVQRIIGISDTRGHLPAQILPNLLQMTREKRQALIQLHQAFDLLRGEASLLLRLLSTTFGDDAAAAYRKQVEAADPAQLEQWSQRLLTTERAGQVFH